MASGGGPAAALDDLRGDMCCIAANVDPAAITEPERFDRCLCEGFAEVLELTTGASPPDQRA